MELLNRERAIVPIEKLRDYCLNPCVAKIFMRPCGCNISGAHRAALGTRLALHDHWPLAWHETESHCRVPDDNVLGGNARRTRSAHDAVSFHQTESPVITLHL